MDSSVLAKCTYSGLTMLFGLSRGSKYDDLCRDVCRRFNFLESDVIELRYALPGSPDCFLQCDSDLEMLFKAVLVFKIDCVDIGVSKLSSSSASIVSVSVDDSASAVFDEEDYFGEPYRTTEGKVYFSREWSDYIKEVGQKFRGGVVDFREKLLKYAIEVGFRFVYVKNDADRIVVDCFNKLRDGCKWHVSGYTSSANGFFYIRELHNVHTCKGVLRTQTSSLLRSSVVKTCIENDVRLNPSITPKEIIRNFKDNYGFDITYKVAYKAKDLAKESIYGGAADSYNMLAWYQESVLESNPGSIFVLEKDESTNRFNRLFLAFYGCVEGFKYCVPVLFVDGTFGKSMYKGQILTAIAKDGDQGKCFLLMSIIFFLVDYLSEIKINIFY